jgi:hypothetical protein
LVGQEPDRSNSRFADSSAWPACAVAHACRTSLGQDLCWPARTTAAAAALGDAVRERIFDKGKPCAPMRVA